MDWDVLPKGVLLGVSVAAPVGPIGLLTIRRTLVSGFRTGLATGFGAATADIVYGLIAALGLTAVMSALVDHADAIRVVGGVMLLYLGARGLLQGRSAGSAHEQRADRVDGAWMSYVQAIGLTLTNPMTILSFLAMFAGVGIVDDGADVLTSALLVVGVGLGSIGWWLFLCTLTNGLRSRLPDGAMTAISVGSSIVIAGFGVAALLAAR